MQRSFRVLIAVAILAATAALGNLAAKVSTQTSAPTAIAQYSPTPSPSESPTMAPR
jgi:hypothetical protein